MTIVTRQRTYRFNVTEAKARFSELVRKAVSGEEVIIVRNNKPLLKLVLLDQPRRARRPGSAKGRVWMASDFDEMPRDFKNYV